MEMLRCAHERNRHGQATPRGMVPVVSNYWTKLTVFASYLLFTSSPQINARQRLWGMLPTLPFKIDTPVESKKGIKSCLKGTLSLILNAKGSTISQSFDYQRA
jgi:hypothetical protein